MATRLAIFNLALFHLGHGPHFNSLHENREERRALDQLYDGQVRYALERGQWKFAMRSVEIESSPSVTPAFGHAYAFTIPSDRLRITGLSTGDYFYPPLNAVAEEGDYWYADVDPIFVRYVSDGLTYGADLARWPESFANFVALRLALMGCVSITKDAKLVPALAKLERNARLDALASDAMQGPTKFMPQGAWVGARGGSMSRRYDRG